MGRGSDKGQSQYSAHNYIDEYNFDGAVCAVTQFRLNTLVLQAYIRIFVHLEPLIQ